MILIYLKVTIANKPHFAVGSTPQLWQVSYCNPRRHKQWHLASFRKGHTMKGGRDACMFRYVVFLGYYIIVARRPKLHSSSLLTRNVSAEFLPHLPPTLHHSLKNTSGNHHLLSLSTVNCIFPHVMKRCLQGYTPLQLFLVFLLLMV